MSWPPSLGLGASMAPKSTEPLSPYPNDRSSRSARAVSLHFARAVSRSHSTAHESLPPEAHRCSLRGWVGKARTVGPWKQREQADYLEKHTANTPHVHLVVVVTVREQTLRGTIPVHQHNTVGYESHFKHCLQCNIHADTLVSCKVMLMASCRQHFEAKVTNEPIGHLGELTNGWRCIPCRAA